MSTTNEVQTAIGALLPTWFLAADIPIANDQIRDYLTSPDDDSPHPNWCILGVVGTTSNGFVLGDTEEPVRMVAVLFARLAQGPNAEASRLAAERWINDAEECVVRGLESLEPNELWTDVTVGQPRRDADRLWHGRYRVSQIPFGVEKR